MSKARDLADLISTGGILADGAVSVSEISDLTATAAELNTLDGITATVAELNTLDGITASTADLNNVTNINTNVQTQLDLKAPLASPTFTGTVTIGGTTYPTSDGTEGQVLTTNGSGAVSFSDPAGGGSADFVASGSISNGDVVVLNSNGTVSVAAETSDTETVGTATNFKTGEASYISAVYDANAGKVVVAYRDNTNSGYGTAVVGTISGASISFGTPVVFESASVFYVSSTYDSNAQKVVIAYRDAANSDYGTAIVGTVSGTSISFGTASVFNSGSTNYTACTFDTSNNKVVIAYQDTGNSSQGTAIVGTVSGTSISFGTEVVFKNSSSDQIQCTFDSSNNKVVIVYKNSSNGLAIVGTVSGTSISFGTEVTFHTGGTYGLGNVTFDSSNNKIVIAYKTSGFDLIVGTVSSTSISFGSATSVTLPSFANVTNVGIGFDTQINKSVIVLDDFGNSKGYVFTATVSGTSISATSLTEWLANRGTYPSLAYDTGNQKFGLFYYNSASPTNSFGRTYKSAYTITNAADYIGVAAEAISNTATGKITINGGINEGQTGLTIGTTYFVADDGSLSTTNNGRKIGKAISATKILVNSNMSGDEMDDYLGSLV